MISLSEKAKVYATERHAAVNQTYDGHPYAYHLGMVANAAEQFLDAYDLEQQQVILAACWCHDLIEDARETYNDVKAVVGEEVAEIVYALTNEKGRNRGERANEKYYAGIRATPFATLVKLCDRIANLTQSKSKGGRMLAVYRKELPAFRSHLYQQGELEAVWKYLNEILES